MTKQYELYGGTPPHSDQHTSLQAATQITESAHTLRAKVLQFITDAGEHGATDLEIQTALDMEGNTERPRRRELVLMKKIRWSGQTRRTTSGRNAKVWIIKEE